MKTAMYTFASFAAIASLQPAPAQADQQTDRAGLVGSWVQNGGNHAWVIDAGAEGLHVTQRLGPRVVGSQIESVDGILLDRSFHRVEVGKSSRLVVQNRCDARILRIEWAPRNIGRRSHSGW